MYTPYSYDDLAHFIETMKIKEHDKKNSRAYFHEETITYSYERRKIQLLTITSTNNIESKSEKEPVIHE